MTERRHDDSTDSPPALGAGFAAWQLARALTAGARHPDAAARQRATGRVAAWSQILGHLAAGSADYGARTPIRDVPAWATLEVMTGGFATGNLLAGGPLQPHEHALLARLPAAGPLPERLALNAYFLTDAGLAELQAWLHSGLYDVRVPEEGALPAVAWLAANGHADAAGAIVDAITPFLATLRFYPAPADRPPPAGPHVHVQDVGAVRAQMAAMPPHRHVAAQKAAVDVWAPLHDRTLSLFAETMDADAWPCRRRPPDWTARAGALLADHAAARAAHAVPSRYRKAGSHHAQLYAFLQRCAVSFDPLTGFEVGRIRHILACSIAKRGLPSGEASRAYRRRQAHDVRAPLHKDIAGVVERRLAACPDGGGLDDIGAVLAPVAADEGGAAVPAGTAIPPYIARKVERCMNETTDVLVRRGLIASAEALAHVLPQMTSGLRSMGIDDPELRTLYAALYRAFRRRRSLLLLNLQSQVRIEELPWVAALDRLRNDKLSGRAAARQALEATVLLAFEHFPHAILPNRLVRELGGLAATAGIDMPLVDELATDIFMGTFAPKFADAARLAGTLLRGSPYATYYRIDYDALAGPAAAPPPARRFGWRRQDARMKGPDFAALCAARAGVPAGGWRPARNGMIIEQQQILTTQNLAALVVRLDLRPALAAYLPDMILACFRWICARNQMRQDDRHGQLIRAKNTAYAWRQMIFFLSLMPAQEARACMDRADAWLACQAPAWQARLRPAFGALQCALDGIVPPPGGILLGWSEGRHPLVD